MPLLATQHLKVTMRKRWRIAVAMLHTCCVSLGAQILRRSKILEDILASASSAGLRSCYRNLRSKADIPGTGTCQDKLA